MSKSVATGFDVIVFEFDLPLVFLLLPLPVVVYLLWPEFRDRGTAVRVPFFQRLITLTGRTPTSGATVLLKRSLQKIAVPMIWLCIIVSLARPVWIGEPIVKQVSMRDLMIVVDLSGSMETRDFADRDDEMIARIDAVKQVLGEFIERRAGDRLGLAVFGNAAYPQAPFTDDHDLVKSLLDELQPRMAGPRTMIGDALGLAVRMFDASTSPHKVTILLTDGNDTGSQMPVGRAARIAADNGITVHTIAMGDPSTIGEDMLDVAVLQEIAELTQGRFFLALDRQGLEDVYAELDRLEPQLVETLSFQPKRNLFHYPLLVAALLLSVLAIAMLVQTSLAGRVRHA